MEKRGPSRLESLGALEKLGQTSLFDCLDDMSLSSDSGGESCSPKEHQCLEGHFFLLL